LEREREREDREKTERRQREKTERKREKRESLVEIFWEFLFFGDLLF